MLSELFKQFETLRTQQLSSTNTVIIKEYDQWKNITNAFEPIKDFMISINIAEEKEQPKTGYYVDDVIRDPKGDVYSYNKFMTDSKNLIPDLYKKIKNEFNAVTISLISELSSQNRASLDMLNVKPETLNIAKAAPQDTHDTEKKNLEMLQQENTLLNQKLKESEEKFAAYESNQARAFETFANNLDPSNLSKKLSVAQNQVREQALEIAMLKNELAAKKQNENVQLEKPDRIKTNPSAFNYSSGSKNDKADRQNDVVPQPKSRTPSKD